MDSAWSMDGLSTLYFHPRQSVHTGDASQDAYDLRVRDDEGVFAWPHGGGPIWVRSSHPPETACAWRVTRDCWAQSLLRFVQCYYMHIINKYNIIIILL
jgi:hypothetical protein